MYNDRSSESPNRKVGGSYINQSSIAKYSSNSQISMDGLLIISKLSSDLNSKRKVYSAKPGSHVNKNNVKAKSSTHNLSVDFDVIRKSPSRYSTRIGLPNSSLNYSYVQQGQFERRKKTDTGTPMPERTNLEDLKDNFTSFVKSLSIMQNHKTITFVQSNNKKIFSKSKWITNDTFNRTKSLFKKHIPHKKRERAKTSKANYKREEVLMKSKASVSVLK